MNPAHRVLSEGEVLRKEPLLQRLTEQLCDVADFQAPHQIEAMHLNGAHADIQAAGDVAVGISLGHQFQNFFLPGRQSLGSFRAHRRRLYDPCRFSLLGR